jgi:hypothetical protein
MKKEVNSKPKLKEFVWEHWFEWKDRSIKDIKKELADVCEMPVDTEMNSFMFSFNNKKKNEKLKLKKNNESEES